MSATPASTDAKATSRASDAMRRPRVRRALGIGALGIVLAASASALDGATRMLNAKLSAAVRDPEAPAPATRPRAMDDDDGVRDGGSHRAFAKTRVRSVREHRLTYDFERDRRRGAGRRRRRARDDEEEASTATEGARDDDARLGGAQDAGVAGEDEFEDEVEDDDDEDDDGDAYSSWARMLREEEDEDEDEGTG